MNALLFANIGEAIGNFLVKALAVAGAGLIGYFTALIGLWLVAKFAFNRQVPKQVHRIVSALSGVALALAVGWLLFLSSAAGGGWGFGPGWGFGTGQSDGDQQEGPPEKTTPERPPATRREVDPVTDANDPGAAPPLRIRMLGGADVKRVDNELAYYQLQPEGKAYTFEGIREVIRARMKDRPPVKGILITIREDSVAHNHPAVKRLEEFAKDERLAITYDLPQ